MAMAIDLKKGTSINLQKKGGGKLEKVCVGLNWGAIKRKSFFGLLSNNEDVPCWMEVPPFLIFIKNG